jgi:hypothetical protein
MEASLSSTVMNAVSKSAASKKEASHISPNNFAKPGQQVEKGGMQINLSLQSCVLIKAIFKYI